MENKDAMKNLETMNMENPSSETEMIPDTVAEEIKQSLQSNGLVTDTVNAILSSDNEGLSIIKKSHLEGEQIIINAENLSAEAQKELYEIQKNYEVKETSTTKWKTIAVIAGVVCISVIVAYCYCYDRNSNKEIIRMQIDERKATNREQEITKREQFREQEITRRLKLKEQEKTKRLKYGINRFIKSLPLSSMLG